MQGRYTAAAALFVASAAAHADTAFTLYGIVDTGIATQRLKGLPETGRSASKTGLISGNQSGSRWGLRGSEDLGDGWQTQFVLESGFSLTDGRSAQGSRLFGRQSTVGLAHKEFGRIDIGRQTNFASRYISVIDSSATSFGQNSFGHAFSSANTPRYDNTVAFQSANYSGFEAGAGYSFRTGNGTSEFQTNRNQRAITTGARYLNGPWNLVVAYDQLNPSRSSDDRTKVRGWLAGGAYDFDIFKIGLAYGQTRNGWFNGQSTSSFGSNGLSSSSQDLYRSYTSVEGFRANSYLVAGSAPVGGSGKVRASWQRIDPKNARLTGGSANVNVYSVGYIYDLSKRTNLYTYASYAKNLAFLDGASSRIAVAGVRHRF